MRLPTEDEINIYNSLDEISACEHFYNKTLKQAEALFRENSMYYQEDLMWMGPRAFNFYLQAVINFLQSDDAAGDDDLISSLYNIVRFRLDEEGSSLLDIAGIKRMVDYIIDNYKKFNVHDVYGDLLGEYQQIQSQLKDMK